MECKIIRLTIKINEADGQYAAECVELGTATCGDTYEEAEKNIREAIQVHIMGLKEAGIFNEYFKKKGIKIKDGEMPKRHKKIQFSTELYKSESTLQLAFCP